MCIFNFGENIFSVKKAAKLLVISINHKIITINFSSIFTFCFLLSLGRGRGNGPHRKRLLYYPSFYSARDEYAGVTLVTVLESVLPRRSLTSARRRSGIDLLFSICNMIWQRSWTLIQFNV